MTGWAGDDKHGENGLLVDAFTPYDPVKVVAVRRVLERYGAGDLAEMIGVAP